MSRSIRILAAGTLLAAGIALAFERASACSVCLAGDPVYSAQGTSAQAEGAVSLFFEARTWHKTSGVLPGEHAEGGEDEEPVPAKERNRSERLDLYASWTPIDRVTLTLDLPWAFNRITEVEGHRRDTSELSGFGDL